MSGLEKYSEIFINHAKELLKDSTEEIHDVYKNHLLGLDGPKQITKNLTPSEMFFSKLYQGFREISDSYHCLLDIEIYIGRFPYGNTKISKTRHLTYHMENHLNEVYILKERLITYLTTVGRLYKREKGHRAILKKTRPVFSFVNEVLKGITNTRSHHVHRKRLSDEDLDRLSSQEFLLEHGGEEFKIIKTLFKNEYRALRRKHKTTIKQNNEQIKQILDVCFDIVYEIVTDSHGQIKYPRSMKA